MRIDTCAVLMKYIRTVPTVKAAVTLFFCLFALQIAIASVTREDTAR